MSTEALTVTKSFKFPDNASIVIGVTSLGGRSKLKLRVLFAAATGRLSKILTSVPLISSSYCEPYISALVTQLVAHARGSAYLKNRGNIPAHRVNVRAIAGWVDCRIDEVYNSCSYSSEFTALRVTGPSI